MIDANRSSFKYFIEQLEESLGRAVLKIIVTPLHGCESNFNTIREAKNFLETYNEEDGQGAFKFYDVAVCYTNGDEIKANFKRKDDLIKFLDYASA